MPLAGRLLRSGQYERGKGRFVIQDDLRSVWLWQKLREIRRLQSARWVHREKHEVF